MLLRKGLLWYIFFRLGGLQKNAVFAECEWGGWIVCLAWVGVLCTELPVCACASFLVEDGTTEWFVYRLGDRILATIDPRACVIGTSMGIYV